MPQHLTATQTQSSLRAATMMVSKQLSIKPIQRLKISITLFVKEEKLKSGKYNNNRLNYQLVKRISVKYLPVLHFFSILLY
jgi:hypothetical protein